MLRHCYIPPTKHLRARFLIVTLVTCLVSAASASGRPVRWRSPDVPAGASMTSVEAAQAPADITRADNVRHVVVQFSEPIGPALRAQLGDAGVELPARSLLLASFRERTGRTDYRVQTNVREETLGTPGAHRTVHGEASCLWGSQESGHERR